MTRHWTYRAVAAVLMLVLLFQLMPLQTLAATTGSAAAEAPQEQASTSILGEDTSLRTQTQKHFRLSDGSFLAVSYGVPVHYQDDRGSWQEIDNTLTLSGSAYRAQNGRMSTAYSTTLSSGQLFAVTNGDVGVSMRLLDTTQAHTMLSEKLSASANVEPVKNGLTYSRTASAAVVSEEEAEAAVFSAAGEAQGWTAEELLPEGLSASVVYEDVFPGVDLKYTAYSHNIKEQIIVNERQSAYRYDFFLALSGLTPEVEKDGSITLTDEAGAAVYTIPAPYMEDSQGYSSTAVTYTLTAVTGGAVLTVEADAAWINAEDRSFPVSIDPTLTLNTGNDNEDIYAAFSMELAPADRTLGRQYLYVGNMPYGDVVGLYRLYMHFHNLPSIPEGSVITDATLNMFQFEFPHSGVNSLPLVVYDVTTEKPSNLDYYYWFRQICWNTEPDYDTSNAIDYAIGSPTNGYRQWNLTELAKQWYAGTKDATIAIIADETLLTPDDRATSGFHAYSSGVPPILTVTYRSIVGIESYYSYTTQSAGRAGTGYLNNYSGSLTWVRGDIGFGGNRMPVSISHIYNSNDAQNNTYGLGNGWRTNFNQRVYIWDQDNNYYVWEDGDGTVHYFLKASEGVYKDEDGLDLTLHTGGSGNTTYYIEDKYGNKSYFDGSGRLYKQQNNQATPSSITVAYTTSTGFQISSVTDGAGRVYAFSYTNSLLSRISYKGSGSSELSYVSFGYSGSNLTTVTDKDGKSCIYGYGSNSLLTTATDIDGYKLQYAYNTTDLYKPSSVVSVKEYDGTVLGGELTVVYAHNQTTLTDVSGNVQILQFNNWGNTVSVQDGEGRAQYARYARDTVSTDKANQLNLSSKLQNTVGNILKDSSFESGTSWTATAGTVSRSVVSGTAYHGSKSLQLTRSAAGGAAGVYSASFSAESGKTYTFSAYVKTGSGMTAYLALNDGSTTVTSETLGANSGWTRLEVSYTASAAKTVTAQLLTTTAGTVYMDCAQVEKAPTASRYNLVENGDFSHGASHWTTADGYATSTGTAAAPELQATVYGVKGAPQSTRRATQTVAVSGAGGDTFVIAGWAKGNAVPMTQADSREFAVLATFHYTDNTTETFAARFNTDVENWQYSASAMVAAKAYSSITVTLAYDYNANTVYFDGIQLFKEEFGTSYTYDGNGNLTKVEDLQGQVTTYEYTNNDLTKVIQNNKTKLSYTYDSYHNVKTATTLEGLSYTFTYDGYGNNTAVSVGSGLTATAVYTTDGNRLQSTTDAAGNTTTYSYNANTNVLEWVKYPKDTDATKTAYTYDSMYRIASAAATTDTGTALTASYTYTDDLLTKITTGSTEYTLSYGDFALRSNIKIGSRTLASYTYASRTHRLTTLDYGNGDKVQYTYDTQGRVTKQTYEDGDTVTYKYDNSGALATVTDSSSGKTTTYYYDLTDRLMKYVESGSGYSHSVGYTYDTLNNLTALVEKVGSTTYTTSYAYDEDNRVKTLTTNGITESYAYDSHGRVTEKVTKNGSTTVLTEQYTYVTTAAGKPTGQVRTCRTISSGRDVTYTYSYDSNGNIATVSDGTHTTRYSYDSANQLTREDNQAAGKSWTYTYDDAGNILSKAEYAYTTGTLGTAVSTVSYTYGDTSWGDLLTGYGGKTVTSDTAGNMLSDGTWTYTWEHGRELASMTGGGTTWSFTYDADGMRTRRTNGSTTYSYVYNGGSLSRMTVGSTTLDFRYDASGTPMTVTYGGTTYYYATNLLGDVVAILNGSGTAVVSYTYDAWGNVLTTTGSLASTLGTHNPLRYRGYVYDTETELYYLQSRYYDPSLGRVLNADAYASTGQGILGNNMFAYCLNNPIRYSDPTGTKVEIWHVLFENHEPGFIHRQVQKHIIWNGLLFKGEFYVPGAGRADILAPDTGEIWEIKHGGSTIEMQESRTQEAINQVHRYIGKFAERPLCEGRAGTFTGAFILNYGNVSYSVTYNTPEPGVILYYVQEMKSYEPAASYAYVPGTSREEKHAVGAMIAYALLGCGLPDPVGEASYAY